MFGAFQKTIKNNIYRFFSQIFILPPFKINESVYETSEDIYMVTSQSQVNSFVTHVKVLFIKLIPLNYL